LVGRTTSTYTLSVKVPPKTGPSTDEIPLLTPKREVYIGRFRRGTSGSMIIMLPVKMPAEPRPAMARPRMKAIEVGAAPQSAEPTSKTTRNMMKTHFVE
jgi:hypothetical protein